MENRELLRLAARAGGVPGHWEWSVLVESGTMECVDGIFQAGSAEARESFWNSLENKGDAEWLAEKLGIRVESIGAGACAVAFINDRPAAAEMSSDDVERAKRRVITLAAAEIGKNMQLVDDPHSN